MRLFPTLLRISLPLVVGFGIAPTLAFACGGGQGGGQAGGRLSQAGRQSGFGTQMGSPMAMAQQFGAQQQAAAMAQVQQGRMRRQAFLAKQNQLRQLKDTDGDGKVSTRESQAFAARQQEQVTQLRSGNRVK